MKEKVARRHLDAQEDTLDNGLTDDLLGAGNHFDANTESAPPGPVAPAWPDLGDDEDYLAPAAGRGKLTTALLVALIFLVGILVGTVVTKTLSPAPVPQVVYVLNDSGTPAPALSPSATR